MTTMTESERIELLKEKHGGHWGEHTEFFIADWKESVANGETRIGYWEWVDDMENAQ